MARPLRIQFPGAMYHIISRGNGRMTIFHNDKDRKKFIEFLERVVKKYNWIIYAYCLMGNHYHMLLETPDANMVPGMKQLNQFYSQFYNWKRRRIGSVFQGRYASWLVEKESKFLDNCRYIVNNPVEAGLAEHPSQWPWSSFRATRGLEEAPSFLETNFLLRHFSSSRKTAQKMYGDFVQAGVGKESPLKEAKKQIFLGSDSFVAEVMQHTNDNDEFNNVPKAQKRPNRPSLQDLFKDHPDISKKARNLLILTAHDTHGYTQREIGDYLQLYPGYISRITLRIRKG
jgi:REP element-mobilizing transposase RayT